MNIYTLVSRTIEIPNTGKTAPPNITKNIIIKNCTSFTDCISETNNFKRSNSNV